MGPENDKYYVKYNQNLDIILKKMRNLLLQRAQMKRSNKEGNEKEN